MNTDTALTQALIPQPALCVQIGQTRSGLDKLKKKDPTFPKPIKFSNARQAAAYYVVAEVEAWLALRRAKPIRRAPPPDVRKRITRPVRTADRSEGRPFPG